MSHLQNSLHTKRNDYPITEHPLAGVIAVLLLLALLFVSADFGGPQVANVQTSSAQATP